MSMQGKLTFGKVWKPLTAVTLWGISFIATKFALRELEPLVIINIRQGIAIPVLAALLLFSGRSLRIRPRQAKMILMLALVSLVHLFIQVTGLKYTTATNTGWIIGATPVFIALMSKLFLKEEISTRKYAGIGISVAGLLLLISKGDLNSLSFITHFGDVLILLSCVTWGMYSVLNRKIALDFPPVNSTFYLFLFMAVLTSPFALNKAGMESILHLSGQGWAAILFLGIFCSAAGYALWSKSLSELETVNVASFLYIEPFITLLAARYLLLEPMTFTTIISGVIIMAGVAFVNFSK